MIIFNTSRGTDEGSDAIHSPLTTSSGHWSCYGEVLLQPGSLSGLSGVAAISLALYTAGVLCVKSSSVALLVAKAIYPLSSVPGCISITVLQARPFYRPPGNPVLVGSDTFGRYQSGIPTHRYGGPEVLQRQWMLSMGRGTYWTWN